MSLIQSRASALSPKFETWLDRGHLRQLSSPDRYNTSGPRAARSVKASAARPLTLQRTVTPLALTREPWRIASDAISPWALARSRRRALPSAARSFVPRAGAAQRPVHRRGADSLGTVANYRAVVRGRVHGFVKYGPGHRGGMGRCSRRSRADERCGGDRDPIRTTSRPFRGRTCPSARRSDPEG